MLIREGVGITARLALVFGVLASPLFSETWMGLEVEPENGVPPTTVIGTTGILNLWSRP